MHSIFDHSMHVIIMLLKWKRGAHVRMHIEKDVSSPVKKMKSHHPFKNPDNYAYYYDACGNLRRITNPNPEEGENIMHEVEYFSKNNKLERFIGVYILNTRLKEEINSRVVNDGYASDILSMIYCEGDPDSIMMLTTIQWDNSRSGIDISFINVSLPLFGMTILYKVKNHAGWLFIEREDTGEYACFRMERGLN